MPARLRLAPSFSTRSTALVLPCVLLPAVLALGG